MIQMRYLLAALALLTSIGAANAQAIVSTSPDVSVTPMTGGGYGIGSRSVVLDKSLAGTPIDTSWAAYTVKVGNFPYPLPAAGSPGFGVGWGTCLVNVANT